MPDVYDKEETDQKPGQTAADSLPRQFDASPSEEPDIKTAEESGDDGTDGGRAEQNELNRIGSGFRDEGRKRFRRDPSKKKGLSSKKKAAFTLGGLGGFVLAIFLLFMLMGQLKVIHFSEVMTATGYARLNSILNERTAQNMFDSAVADGKGALAPGKASLWDRMRRADPTAELTRLGQEGKFKFNFADDRKAFSLRTNEKFQGVTIDGETINLSDLSKEFGYGDSYYKLVDPRKKAAVRYEFTKRTQASINEKFANEPRFVRSAATKVVMDNVGFKFSKWRQEGRKFTGLDTKAALAENYAESAENRSGAVKPPQTGVKTLDDTINELNSPENIKEYIKSQGGNPDLTERMLKTFEKHNASAAKVRTVASNVGQATMLASMACMTNLAFKHIPEVERNNQHQAEAAGLELSAAGSQSKYGDTTPEAVGAEATMLEGAENSPAYQQAIGSKDPKVPSDLASANIRSPSFNSDSTLFKAVDTLTSPSTFLLGPASFAIPGAFKDKADEYFCSKLLSPEGLVVATVGEVAVQAVIGFFSAGSGTVASEAGAATGIKLFVGELGKALLSTSKGLVSTKTVATAGAFGAYAFGMETLVGYLSAQSFGGTDTGATRLENSATGIKAVQNHESRKVLYGRPLSVAERRASNSEAQNTVRTAYTSGNAFNRYLSTSNPFSASSRAVAYMPSSFSSLSVTAQHGVAHMGSMFSPSNLLSPLLGKKASAQTDTYQDPEDNMVSWGYSLEEQELMRSDPSYGLEQNSAIVEPILAQLDAKYGVCYDTVDQYDADKLSQQAPCDAASLSTTEALRYRIYKGPDSYIVNDREHGLDDMLSGSSSSQTTTPAESSDTGVILPAQCYTVTRQRGSKTEGNMFHKDDKYRSVGGPYTYAMENSPEGIKWAATHKDLDGRDFNSIDLDIQITKDGVPVNTHWGQPMAKDGFYDPQHKLGEGTQVSDMTVAEVTRLRNHDGRSQIYTLEDQIKVLAENHMNLSMELKTKALVAKFSEITGQLNQYKIKAYIKADAGKPPLDKALTAARNYGYWTRGTEGSQDWKAPGPSCI